MSTTLTSNLPNWMDHKDSVYLESSLSWHQKFKVLFGEMSCPSWRTIIISLLLTCVTVETFSLFTLLNFIKQMDLKVILTVEIVDISVIIFTDTQTYRLILFLRWFHSIKVVIMIFSFDFSTSHCQCPVKYISRSQGLGVQESYTPIR